MKALKVVARLLAQERGEAVQISRERAYPISDRPLVMIPIVMAGEAPALFALGIGDGSKPCIVHVCAEPRNRDQQYNMLERAATDMQTILATWERNPALMPQVITSSRDASRMCLATIQRMAYAPRPALKKAGRQLFWLDRRCEQPDSACVLSMPAAICELYATGQDDHADSHLGALLEWLKPADGQIYDRIIEAEDSPASTSTHPRLDNKKLVPLLDALRKAEDTGDEETAFELRSQIGNALHTEVERRYALIQTALGICRRFESSSVADHIQDRDREHHDRNFAYVADPNNQLAASLSGDPATAEFLSRELNAAHVEQLMLRSVSAARASARLSGDILIGRVKDRRQYKDGRKTIITYDIETSQERLSVRRGDKLTLIDNESLVFVVEDFALAASGDTIVSLRLKAGIRSFNQPNVGDSMELLEPLDMAERIGRTMGLAHERLRNKPQLRPVSGKLSIRRDYLAGVRALRRNG
jgi:hypothetical protein